MNRRKFLKTGTAAAAGLLLMKSRTAFGYQASSAVASSFAKNTSAQIVALADLFADQLAAGREHFNQVNAGSGAQPIAERLMFHGPHAYEQLAASPDVDLIQISTPPFFHVQHLEAAVASGKNV